MAKKALCIGINNYPGTHMGQARLLIMGGFQSWRLRASGGLAAK